MLLFVIALVVGSASAFAQSVDELGGANPPVTSTDPVGTDVGDGQVGQSQQPDLPISQPPTWETRQGVEVAARNYFEAKAEYISCRCRGDKPGMARAAKRMKTHSSALAAFKKQQAARDAGQDARLDKHSELVWKHETQINGRNGIKDRLGKVEGDVKSLKDKDIKDLKDEMDKASLAIGGIDGKFDGLTFWLLVLTLIVIVGFGRRYWINR